jgi:hypothetical protein
MLFGSLHCREARSGVDCPRAMLRTGSRLWRCSKTLTRLLSSALIVIVVLGLAVRPYAAACASLSCDGMVNCDPCDAMPHECPHALACVKLIPQEETAEITGLYWDKLDWERGSPRVAGIEVPPEHPPPIVD